MFQHPFFEVSTSLGGTESPSHRLTGRIAACSANFDTEDVPVLKASEARYDSYVAAIRTVLLKAAALLFSESSFNVTYSGRGGSSKFETRIRPVITSDSFTARLMSDLAASQVSVLGTEGDVAWQITGARFVEAANDSHGNENREPWDVGLELVLSGPDGAQRRLVVAINIKLVKDDVGSNVCGGKAFGYLMTGEVRGKKSLDRILELRGALDADVLSDYFLWAFKKQSKKDEGAPEVWVASLGSIDPNGGALVFNPAQTFPHLQVRYRSAAEGLTNALINGLLPHSIVDARRALREFLHDKNVDYLKKQLKAWQAVQRSD